MNRSKRQMIADYTDRYGITPDRDEPPPERAAQPDPAVTRAILRFEQARRAEHERNAK